MRNSLKKSLLVLLALLSMVFIVSCRDKDKLSKKEIIEKFVENSKNIKSMDMLVNTRFEQGIEERAEPDFTGMEMGISMILEPFSMKVEMKTPFLDAKSIVYITEDYIYVFDPNSKLWSKQKNKEFSKQYKIIIASANEMYNLFKTYIDRVDLEEKNGDYIISIANLKNILKQQPSLMNFSNINLDMIENFTLTYIVDKEKLLPKNLIILVAVNLGNDTKMSLSMEGKYSNINSVKEIDVPKEAIDAREIIDEENKK